MKSLCSGSERQVTLAASRAWTGPVRAGDNNWGRVKKNKLRYFRETCWGTGPGEPFVLYLPTEVSRYTLYTVY